MHYNWQQDDWPNFSYDLSEASRTLPEISLLSGRVSGIVEGFSEGMEVEAILDLMIAEAIETSDIEGESLQHDDVKSSIKNNLGLNVIDDQVSDQRAEGLGELIVLARNQFDRPLSEAMLFEWHSLLLKGVKNIPVGEWRSGAAAMRVISGRIGNPTIHFEAPPSDQVPSEMKCFICWFNDSKKNLPGAVRAAIAHLYFESIHPFEDGNGRIGRAIAEKALSQGQGSPVLLSLSRSINAKKKKYYTALQNAQRSNKITPWLNYFIDTILDAQQSSEKEIHFLLKKAKFYRKHEDELNQRQHKAMERMFRAGASGFTGGMNAQKYIGITKTSKATATRDLQDLLGKGALRVIGKGRNTHYQLKL
ncbi:MAG: Fic family protein [Akkermansiaceae bacterium]